MIYWSVIERKKESFNSWEESLSKEMWSRHSLLCTGNAEICAATLSALHHTLSYSISRYLHLLPFPCPPFYHPTVFSISRTHLYPFNSYTRGVGDWVAGGLGVDKNKTKFKIIFFLPHLPKPQPISWSLSIFSWSHLHISRILKPDTPQKGKKRRDYAPAHLHSHIGDWTHIIELFFFF